MEEKRKIIQEKIYDENGKLKYTIIPNYKKTEYFMSREEIRFYKFLITVVKKIKEAQNVDLKIFPQVAINRIIQQNNQREKELEKDIFARSIDFVLYNQTNEEIFCCIELDGIEHKTDKERIERDKIIENAFLGLYKLLRIDVSNHYDLNEIINKIIN